MKPINLGNSFLVEDCQRVELKGYLRGARAKLKEALLTAEMTAQGVPVGLTASRTGFGGTRYWFVCPSCGRRVGVLFVHPVSQAVGCRKCLNLEYRKRRFKGMVESNPYEQK